MPRPGGESRRVGGRGTFGRPIVEWQLGEPADIEHAADGPFRAAPGFLHDHAEIAPAMAIPTSVMPPKNTVASITEAQPGGV